MESIYRQFALDGLPISCARYGSGHINETYLLVTSRPHLYILQKINSYVFHDAAGLMNNIIAVTDALRRQDPDPRHVLTLVPTLEGKLYLTTPSGEYWRLYEFVTDSLCLDKPESVDDLRQSGVAFGMFQNQLAGFPAHTLTETIPHFHDTPARYGQLRQAMEENRAGRLEEVRAELDWLLRVEDEACALTDRFRAGELPLRVTHNDTKINNVLFDTQTHKPLVVIDLDTVMPGLIGHDFGDAIRFAANFVEEDCPDASKAGVNLNIYWAFAEGFLKYTASTLTEAEVETLGTSCFALACELATRFLDDYILGDRYFKIKYPTHNLVRTRCQIALAKDMQRKMNAMNAIVLDCWRRNR